ncbi:MAG: hypothetical protein ACKO29_05030 [Actinomycetota bacterium]
MSGKPVTAGFGSNAGALGFALPLMTLQASLLLLRCRDGAK